MTDGMVQAIATITVAFLGILVPLLTIITKDVRKTKRLTEEEHKLLVKLCNEVYGPPRVPKHLLNKIPPEDIKL